jgi:hypothetical protein
MSDGNSEAPSTKISPLSTPSPETPSQRVPAQGTHSKATLSPADTPASLKSLRELPLPEAVSYAPQTIGWAVLAVVLVAAALLGAWAAWRRHRAQRYRREALLELTEIEGRLSHTEQRAAALAAIAKLLKRTSLAAAPRARVASLTGDAWLDFLRLTRGHFDERSARLLSLASYAPADHLAAISEHEAAALVKQSRDWIRQHHVEV